VVTDRDPIPAPSAPAAIPDRFVRVPETAGEEALRASDEDGAPPVEVCETARALLDGERAASLTEEARRRLQQLRAYCVRTRSTEATLPGPSERRP
jgi:hypothetical protein